MRDMVLRLRTARDAVARAQCALVAAGSRRIFRSVRWMIRLASARRGSIVLKAHEPHPALASPGTESGVGQSHGDAAAGGARAERLGPRSTAAARLSSRRPGIAHAQSR